AYFDYMPQNFRDAPKMGATRAPKAGTRPLEQVIVVDENKPFDMFEVIDAIIDEGSFVELKRRFAKELITGFARIEGRAIGIVANPPRHLGGGVFVCRRA